MHGTWCIPAHNACRNDGISLPKCTASTCLMPAHNNAPALMHDDMMASARPDAQHPHVSCLLDKKPPARRMVAVVRLLGLSSSSTLCPSRLELEVSIAAICSAADTLRVFSAAAAVARPRVDRLGLVAARDPRADVVEPS